MEPTAGDAFSDFGVEISDSLGLWRAVCRPCEFVSGWQEPLMAAAELQEHYERRHRE